MKILVTGGAGYIGSICTEEILNLGDTVVVFDNLTEGHRAAIDPRAKFIEGDLADRDFIFKTVAEEKPDAVMHFAANALVGESMTNPSKYFRNNVGSGINLIDAMVDANIKQFVFSSTCATYGTPERVPLDEDLPQRPINPYGESKLMFEHVLKWYEKIHGLVHVNLRYFNAAGASEKYGEDHRIETHLIPNVLKVALGQRERVEMFGDKYDTPDGTCIRDYIHVKDLSAAHLLAISAKQSAAYNLGTGEGFSVMEVVKAARKVTGHEIPSVIKPSRAGDPARLISASGKIANELGWKPRFNTIEPILENAWAWHSKYPNGYGD